MGDPSPPCEALTALGRAFRRRSTGFLWLGTGTETLSVVLRKGEVAAVRPGTDARVPVEPAPGPDGSVRLKLERVLAQVGLGASALLQGSRPGAPDPRERLVALLAGGGEGRFEAADPVLGEDERSVGPTERVLLDAAARLKDDRLLGGLLGDLDRPLALPPDPRGDRSLTARRRRSSPRSTESRGSRRARSSPRRQRRGKTGPGRAAPDRTRGLGTVAVVEGSASSSDRPGRRGRRDVHGQAVVRGQVAARGQAGARGPSRRPRPSRRRRPGRHRRRSGRLRPGWRPKAKPSPEAQAVARGQAVTECPRPRRPRGQAVTGARAHPAARRPRRARPAAEATAAQAGPTTGDPRTVRAPAESQPLRGPGPGARAAAPRT